MSSPAENQDPPTASTPPSVRAKLRKIPPIPIRRTKLDNSEVEPQDNREQSGNDDSPILLASSLGLNHIKTKYASPLRFSSSSGGAMNAENDTKKEKVEPDMKLKFIVPQSSKASSGESGFLFFFFPCDCYLPLNIVDSFYD